MSKKEIEYPEITLEQFADMYHHVAPWWQFLSQTPDIKPGKTLVTMIQYPGAPNEKKQVFWIPSEKPIDHEHKTAVLLSDEELLFINDILLYFINRVEGDKTSNNWTLPKKEISELAEAIRVKKIAPMAVAILRNRSGKINP